jgi:hypothetical protein
MSPSSESSVCITIPGKHYHIRQVTYRGVDDCNGRAFIQTHISDTETGTWMILKHLSLVNWKVPYVDNTVVSPRCYFSVSWKGTLRKDHCKKNWQFAGLLELRNVETCVSKTRKTWTSLPMKLNIPLHSESLMEWGQAKLRWRMSHYRCQVQHYMLGWQPERREQPRPCQR